MRIKMKSKIVIYIVLLIVGIAIGVGGSSLVPIIKTSNEHNLETEETLYSCGMHPNIIEKEAGTCPICGMNLTPIKGSKKKTNIDPKDRVIIYWRAPMNPNEVYDAPGKSQMGMDLVPVYKDEAASSGVVTVDGSVLQSMNVKMKLVKLQKLSSTIYTNGVLEIDERKELALTTKFDGWIEKLYVNFTGQEVKKGQKLVEIYSPKLVAAQQELLTAVNYEALNNSSSKVELIKNAKQKLELLDISKSDIDQILKTKKINKYMTLYAPFNGTVLTKNVLEGEMVKAGKEIIKMADLTNLWLKADIYESELNKINVGSKAEVKFSYNPEKTYGGKITFIYPTLDTRTRTISVRINIKNNGELKPSMFGNVIIRGNDIGEVLTIPETAVLRSGKRNIVILSLGDGRFKPVDVTLGLYSDGLYQVLSGLKLNDAFVSSGQFMIDSESSLRSAVNLFTSDNTSNAPQKVMSNKEMKNMNKHDLKEMDKMESVPKEETHTKEHKHKISIVHTGIIDVEAIDKNSNGKVFQDPMDWYVISDLEGRCPLCGMFLKEATIDEAKMNLKMNGFEYK